MAIISYETIPLGKIYPAANFATKCAPILMNLGTGGSFRPLPGFPPYPAGIIITADPNNVSDIFVCVNALPPDLTNYSNVLCALGGGQVFTDVSSRGYTRDPGALFIGAANATDFCIGYLEF